MTMAMSACDIFDSEQAWCFCPEESCKFTTGSTTSLLEHVERAHKLPVFKMHYDMDFRISIPSSCQFMLLMAEDDNSVFAVRSIDEIRSGGRLFWVVHVGNHGEGLERTKFDYEIRAEGFKYVLNGKNGAKKITTVEDGSKMRTFVRGSTLEFRDDNTIKLFVNPKMKQPKSGEVKLCLRIGVSNNPRVHVGSNIFLIDRDN